MKIHIVAEGDLEIPVARKLIMFCGHRPGNRYVLRGFGNVEKNAASYACLLEEGVAVLVLTDFMDAKSPCFN
ncbi:MAG: hypothetical protein IJD16_08090 [Desulfovibrio sp.]|nr:hypothetical protein [Desulfovibrio sp.]